MVIGVTVSWRFHCSMRLFSMQYRPIDYAKRSFYRAANGIFAKLGRLASEEVILELIFSRLIFRLTVF